MVSLNTITGASLLTNVIPTRRQKMKKSGRRSPGKMGGSKKKKKSGRRK